MSRFAIALSVLAFSAPALADYSQHTNPSDSYPAIAASSVSIAAGEGSAAKAYAATGKATVRKQIHAALSQADWNAIATEARDTALNRAAPLGCEGECGIYKVEARCYVEGVMYGGLAVCSANVTINWN